MLKLPHQAWLTFWGTVILPETVEGLYIIPGYWGRVLESILGSNPGRKSKNTSLISYRITIMW